MGDGIPRTTADVLRDGFHDAILDQVAAELDGITCPQTKPPRHKFWKILLQLKRNEGISLAVGVSETQLLRGHLRGVRRNKRIVLGGVANDVKRHGESALTLGLLILASCDQALRPVGQGSGTFSNAEQPVIQFPSNDPQIRLLVVNAVEGKSLDVCADVRSQTLGFFHQRPECIAEDSDVLGIGVLEGWPLQGENRVLSGQGIADYNRQGIEWVFGDATVEKFAVAVLNCARQLALNRLTVQIDQHRQTVDFLQRLDVLFLLQCDF